MPGLRPIPRRLLTDTMMVRTPDGHGGYAEGVAERLVRFVKGNFVAGRTFDNVTQLNDAALEWRDAQGSRYRGAVDCVPLEEHAASCVPRARPLEVTQELSMYLCPQRKVSFDGFVNYEGRRFGVPSRRF